MSLSEHENELWKHATENLDDPIVDFRPLRLPTPVILETPAELWDLLERSRAQRKLSGESIGLAIEFFGNIFLSGDPKSVIAELPYEQGDDGLEVILQFPHHGANNE